MSIRKRKRGVVLTLGAGCLLLYLAGCAVPGNEQSIMDISGGWSYAPAVAPETPQDAEEKSFAELSSLLHLEEKLEGGEGYIWLRKEFQLPDKLEDERIALLLGRITMADITYLNGHYIGRMGAFPPNFFSEWNSYRYYPAFETFLHRNGENTLLTKIYVRGEGSISGRVLLGEMEEIRGIYRLEEFLNSNINIIISAVLLIMALYHLLMFFGRKKDRENLYYALITFGFSLYLSNFFITRVPGFYQWDLSYVVFQKIIFISVFLVAYSVTQFFREFLDRSDPQWMKRTLGIVSLAPAVLYVFLPGYRALHTVVGYTQLLLFVHVAYVIYATVSSAMEKRREAYVLMLGLSPFILAIVFDLIIHQLLRMDELIYLSGLGMSAFLIAILFILAGRFVRYHNEVDVLNTELENKVDERTRELQKANSELEDALEELRKRNEMNKRDMEMAASVQATLYPQKSPETGNWGVAHYFQPASSVSGDLYDYYMENNMLRGAALFDVSGHGVASGLITMIAKSIARRNVYRMKDAALGNVLYRINEGLIREISGVDNYLTGIMVRLHDSYVEYVNAGHTELLYRSARTGRVREVNKEKRDFKGMFLGIPDLLSRFKVLSFRVHEDDLLLMYSDGLIETANSEGESYGSQRLKAALEHAPAASPDQVLQHIVEDFYSFVGSRELPDDLTAVLLKRK
jgi:sigma-B regulation protein RsbU (phosphoserine phosphatase)